MPARDCEWSKRVHLAVRSVALHPCNLGKLANCRVAISCVVCCCVVCCVFVPFIASILLHLCVACFFLSILGARKEEGGKGKKERKTEGRRSDTCCCC